MSRLDRCPSLVAITDFDRIDPQLFLEGIRRLCAGRDPSSIAIQIRQPGWSAGRLLEMTRWLIAQTSPPSHPIALIVNDRLDVARALGIRNVHLRTHGVSVADARAYLGDCWISVATHDLAGIADARDSGADAVVCSPIFAVPGKGTPLGIDGLRIACEAAGDMPLIALGGVDSTSENKCIEAGARGVAMIRGVLRRDEDL